MMCAPELEHDVPPCSLPLPPGVVKVIELKQQQSGKRKDKKHKGGKGGAPQPPAVTGASALKALLQPAAGLGTGLPAWD